MLQELLERYQIVLGSKSPRRQQFLKELNIPFTCRTTEVEEVYSNKLQKEQITSYLADLKSKHIAINNNELLITSDTIVWSNNKALEKPSNTKEATQMLQQLSGKWHQVITSVKLTTTKHSKLFTDTTLVYFNKLDADEISHYIQHYQPYDKAGSYGIQEWIGLIGVEKIEGSYTNVVGLPTHKLYQELKNFL
ncbi:Maf family nucleotide pyrophosphatase [Ochrovirga pacifica]|uniref:Maf family nucleotide pyrophosphatase n=1 Tax=Ochrovirga pacifica TaxID=1042376 RepID=UPI000255A7F1|nr:Maf family nucleotide pyrophosphatase [Ochrovirga pacifica]